MSDNPFGDPNDVNPFATPPATSHNPVIDDYNPFADNSAPPPSTVQQPIFVPTQNYTAATPATIEPTRAEPSYVSKPYPGAHVEDASLRNRQDELERKAAELEKKEQELRKIQQNNGKKENNFPPLPKFCCVQPCFYQDISVEIPMESQRTAKMMFYVWELYAFTLLFNFICSLAYLCTGGPAVAFGVSILYLFLFFPCSYVIWFRPIYKALRSDSSFNYMLFFFIFFFQIICCVVYSLGFDVLGTCGWINAAGHLDNGNHAVAAMMFICATLFTLLTIFMVLLLRKVHASYRRSGASLEKAQGEFARGVASNKNVQNAASEAVKGGLSGGSGNKY